LQQIESTLRIKNSDYKPNKSSFFVEQYIEFVYKKIQHELLLNPISNFQEKIPKVIKTTIQLLINDSTIVIKNADKNYGLVIVNMKTRR
jgi:hypothetical protein